LANRTAWQKRWNFEVAGAKQKMRNANKKKAELKTVA